MGKKIKKGEYKGFSLEDKLDIIELPVVGSVLGFLCECTAWHLAKNPSVYEGISEIQTGTGNLMPDTPYEAAAYTALYGGAIITLSLISGYKKFKEKRNRYQNL